MIWKDWGERKCWALTYIYNNRGLIPADSGSTYTYALSILQLLKITNLFCLFLYKRVWVWRVWLYTVYSVLYSILYRVDLADILIHQFAFNSPATGNTRLLSNFITWGENHFGVIVMDTSLFSNEIAMFSIGHRTGFSRSFGQSATALWFHLDHVRGFPQG